MASIDGFLARASIAYFTMEIALRPEMHTYAGGLGILAGDTARSAAELELPVVFVSLVSRAGYFRQTIDEGGWQREEPDTWTPGQFCEPLDVMVAVTIEKRVVWIRPWLYVHTCPHGSQVAVLLLDTDLDQNAEEDRRITSFLYGGDEAYRLKQEIVLGMGGMHTLYALGFDIHTYHLNEGHAALLTLELLKRHRLAEEGLGIDQSRYDIAEVRERCVFTTHTPVEAGHDRFSYDLVQRFMQDYMPMEDIKRLGGRERLNMTQLALHLSGYINGVARRHAETTTQMFPGRHIHSITNGIHVGTWTHEAMARLYEQHVPNWQHEPEMLVRVLQLDPDEIWQCHDKARTDLISTVRDISGQQLDPAQPIIGYARRMTGYKRPLLIFQDMQRLAAIAEERPFTLVFAGKAHPRDNDGKAAIRQIHDCMSQLQGRVSCVFLPNYDMRLARTLVAGSDIWLNTPLPPFEASGTSGMKAALNGGLNFSVLDGWWIEAWIEGVTGWAIGQDRPEDGHHAQDFYEKLQATVLPLYYDRPKEWRNMMKQTIANVGYYFNSQRMMRRYASEAYLR